MHERSVRHLAAVTLVAGAALAWATGARAAGVVNIDTSRLLDSPNTTYKLTRDLTSCDAACLIVLEDRSRRDDRRASRLSPPR